MINVDADDRANLGMLEPEVLRPPVLLMTQAKISPPSTISDRDGAAGPVPPGSYPFGKSPYGLHDMAGNVAEWVIDWYTENGYGGLPLIDPRGATAGTNGLRVVRGGSFADPRFYARTYHRRAQPDTVASVTVGLRCVRDIR
jgi:formylglycine-generating enzyme required for sulfatase activity